MNIRRFFIAKTIGFFVVVVLVGSFFLLNNFIYQEKQGDGTVPEPYRASLEGEYVCLKYEDDIDTSTEQECESGIKTDAEEYYAVNFYLMSQMHAPLEEGQRFSATGVVTPIERLSTDQWQKYNVSGIFSVTDSVTLLSDDGEPFACDGDAKLCPDGTYVGRQGPLCEFTECSPNVALPIEVTALLGESVSVNNLNILPNEIISDSRCPIGVECIWAGTVEVRTAISTEVAQGEHVLKLNEPQVFGDYLVTLVSVQPAKTQETFSDDLYKFTYLVSLK